RHSGVAAFLHLLLRNPPLASTGSRHGACPARLRPSWLVKARPGADLNGTRCTSPWPDAAKDHVSAPLARMPRTPASHGHRRGAGGIGERVGTRHFLDDGGTQPGRFASQHTRITPINDSLSRDTTASVWFISRSHAIAHA